MKNYIKFEEISSINLKDKSLIENSFYTNTFWGSKFIYTSKFDSESMINVIEDKFKEYKGYNGTFYTKCSVELCMSNGGVYYIYFDDMEMAENYAEDIIQGRYSQFLQVK